MQIEPADCDELASVLDAWSWQGKPEARALDGGLINATWLVRVAGVDAGVLQRLNTRVFRPEVHLDLHAVTQHVARKGLPTPQLVPTTNGELWLVRGAGVYRVLTLVGDETLHRLASPVQARSAAGLVARFHGALRDFRGEFAHVRLGAHDVAGHLRALDDAVASGGQHRLYAQVAPLSEAIADAWRRLAPQLPQGLPRRVIHGDLKISNVRFRNGEAYALIDLDTLAWGTLDVELGDALRSWCNVASEDSAHPIFSEELFAAANGAYLADARRWGLSDVEAAAIRPGVARVALTLAARFARDALEESYFGWDASKYPAAGEHNLLRARGQAALVGQVIPSAAVAVTPAG